MRHDLLLRASLSSFYIFVALGCGEPHAEVGQLDAAVSDAAVSDASPTPDGGPAPDDAGRTAAVSPREFASQRAEAICAELFVCCDAAQLELVLHQHVADEPACAALLSSAYADWVGQVESAVERGTLEYDPYRASACIAAIVALDCDTLDVRVPPDACRRVALGRVSDGGACAMEDECADASSCRDGVCVAPVADGADCTAAPCGLGFYCGGMGAGPRCHPLVPNGEACVIDSQCASRYCEDDSICAASRACEQR